jgi:hypothetical protein
MDLLFIRLVLQLAVDLEHQALAVTVMVLLAQTDLL